MTDDRNDRNNETPGLSPKGTAPTGVDETTDRPSSDAGGGRTTLTQVSAEAAEVEDDLRSQAAAAEARAEEHLKDLQRLAAEFDNYRKRVIRDQELSAARAREQILKDLLPVLDDLERAIEAAEQHEEAKLEDGVRLVHRALEDVLRRQGLEEIEAEGRFDPHVHEALLAQPSDAEEGSVIQVAQKGYRLGDLVLRPARVIVSAGSGQETDG